MTDKIKTDYNINGRSRLKTDEAYQIKEAVPELNGQEFRPLIYQGQVIPGYEIAKDGLVVSYKRYKDGQTMGWAGVGSHGTKYPAVRLQLPVECLSYVNKNAVTFNHTTQQQARSIKVHILVADSWLDIEEECPDTLKPWWKDIPLEFKKSLRPFFSIDHKDDNRLNPHVDNLKFVSPRENQACIKANS